MPFSLSGTCHYISLYPIKYSFGGLITILHLFFFLSRFSPWQNGENGEEKFAIFAIDSRLRHFAIDFRHNGENGQHFLTIMTKNFAIFAIIVCHFSIFAILAINFLAIFIIMAKMARMAKKNYRNFSPFLLFSFFLKSRWLMAMSPPYMN